jgi:hypothetical protein
MPIKANIKIIIIHVCHVILEKKLIIELDPLEEVGVAGEIFVGVISGKLGKSSESKLVMDLMLS